MSDETEHDSGKEQKQRMRTSTRFLFPPPLLSENDDDNHVEDAVVEVDMNSDCNVIVKWNETGSYQCACGPWYLHDLLFGSCPQKTD